MLSMKEALILVERWRREYNTVVPWIIGHWHPRPYRVNGVKLGERASQKRFLPAVPQAAA